MASILDPLAKSLLEPKLATIAETARKLLEEYSGIPSERVIPHIVETRERAWKVVWIACSYYKEELPLTFAVISLSVYRTVRFLELSIRTTAYYDEVVQRLKDGQKFLDPGRCFGQDIGKLVYDGAPAENIYGTDLRMDFVNTSYELFLGEEKLKSKFIAANVFDPESDLKQLNSKIDMVYAASFFHLFNWDDSVRPAKRVVTLLRPQPGCLIMGRRVGNNNPKEHSRGLLSKSTMYRHDVASFKRMWDQVGAETGTE